MEVYKMLFREDLTIQASKLIDTPANRVSVLGSDMRFVEPYRQDLFCMLLTDEFVEYHTELDNYFVTNMLAYIMGDKDIDATWDAYVEEYLNMGGEEERQSQLAMRTTPALARITRLLSNPL